MSERGPTSVLGMNEAPGSDVQGEEDAVSEITSRPAVTYTMKELEDGVGGVARRTILFRRTSAGQSIEIRTETDAPNLLAMLPALLESALKAHQALRFARFADEVRRVRWLTEGRRLARRRAHRDDAAHRRGLLRGRPRR
jgi:hypothetical protein